MVKANSRSTQSLLAGILSSKIKFDFDSSTKKARSCDNVRMSGERWEMWKTMEN